MDVFTQAVHELSLQRQKIVQFQQQQVTEYENMLQNAVQLIDQLINSLQQLATVISQLNSDAQPDITYRSHAAIIVGCDSFLIEQAQYIKARFPGYNFITPTRIQQLIPSYIQIKDIINANQVAQNKTEQNAQPEKASIWKLLFKKINFLDSKLLRQKNVNDVQVLPQRPMQTFQRLTHSGVPPEAVNRRMYPQAIHIGRGLPIRPGKQIPYIQDEQTYQKNPINIIRNVENQDIQIHLVTGHLFIQGNTDIQQITQLTKYQDYLRLAKLSSAIKPDGTLGKPYVKAKQEYLVALSALSELLSLEAKQNQIQLDGINSNAPRIPAHPQTPKKYSMVGDNQKTIEQVSNFLLKIPQLQNDLRFSEVLQEAKSKCEQYFECCASIRRAAYLIKTQSQSIPNEIQFTIQQKMLSNDEEIQYKNEMYSQITQLVGLEKAFQLFEKLEEAKKKNIQIEKGKQLNLDKLQLELDQLSTEFDLKQQEKEQEYLNQLYIDEVLPSSFIVSFNGISGPNVKVQLIVNGHVQSTCQIPFQDVTKVQGDQLGTDLSVIPSGGINYFVTMKQLPNIQIRLTIGRKTFTLKIPLRLGEQTTALDTVIDGLELTLGYFLRVRGGGYEPNRDDKKQQYGYDPNLRYRLTHEKPKQNVAERQENEQVKPQDTIRSVKNYRGGSYAQFCQAIKSYYALENQNNNMYDSDNYINLLQTRRGSSMQILETRKATFGGYKRKELNTPRFALEDVWRGPNNEPLFFNQYLSSIRLLYQNLESQNQNFQQELQILWTDRKWVNPFLPPQIKWHSRPTYPVQLMATQSGKDLYQRYKDQFIDYDVSESDDEVTASYGQRMEWEKKEQEADLAELYDADKLVHGLCKTPWVSLVLRVDTMFMLPQEDCTQATSFFFAAKISGSGLPSYNTYEQAKHGNRGIVYFGETVYLDIPLPAIVVLEPTTPGNSQAGEDQDANQMIERKIGYELTDSSLSTLPYALRLNIYRIDKYLQSTSLVGGCTIPLRTVFLAGGLRGDIGLTETISVRIAVEFSPSRVPLNYSSQLFSCTDANMFRGELPLDFWPIWNEIQSISTRFGGAGSSSGAAGSLNALNFRERDALLSLDAKQRKKYISSHTRPLEWWKRGVSLFCQACTGEYKFINDFILQSGQARELRQFLGLNTQADCARFAASIPFIASVVSRYYVKTRFGKIPAEIRLNFNEVLTLSGGDYFEHACILQAMLKSCGFNAYVARGCTQTLINEYFVVLFKGNWKPYQREQSSLVFDQNQEARYVIAIDAVSGGGYLLWGEKARIHTAPKLGASSENLAAFSNGQITLQRYFTKISMLFDAERIFINLQPEMHPAFTEYDLNDQESWSVIEHQSTHKEVPFHDHFFIDFKTYVQEMKERGEIDAETPEDQISPKVSGSLASARRMEIIQTAKDFISQYETRRGLFTKFNDELAEHYAKDPKQILDKYDCVPATIECPYEDSASLLERIENAAVTEVYDPLAECLVCCNFQTFGLKFAHIKLDIVWVKPSSSNEPRNNQRFLQQKGAYSIWV